MVAEGVVEEVVAVGDGADPEAVSQDVDGVVGYRPFDGGAAVGIHHDLANRCWVWIYRCRIYRVWINRVWINRVWVGNSDRAPQICAPVVVETHFIERLHRGIGVEEFCFSKANGGDPRAVAENRREPNAVPCQGHAGCVFGADAGRSWVKVRALNGDGPRGSRGVAPEQRGIGEISHGLLRCRRAIDLPIAEISIDRVDE